MSAIIKRDMRDGAVVDRLIELVTEQGKFAYGSVSRCLEVVEGVFNKFRRTCDNLHSVSQEFGLGLGGENVDEVVCDKLRELLSFASACKWDMQAWNLMGRTLLRIAKLKSRATATDVLFMMMLPTEQRQCDLAKAMGVPMSTVQDLRKRLTRLELITITRKGGNVRFGSRIELTEKGRAIFNGKES